MPTDAVCDASITAVAERLGLAPSCITASDSDGGFSERFEVCRDGRHFFAKLLPKDPELRRFCDLVGLFDREQRFYGACAEASMAKIQDTVLHLPKLHHSSNGLLLLDDLHFDGFVSCKPSMLLCVDGMRLALKALAEFHACFPEDTAGFLPRHRWPGFRENIVPLIHSGLLVLKQRAYMRAEVVAQLEDGRIVEILTSAVEGPLVFCHGDAFVSNVLLHREGKRAAFVDFQFVGPSCAADDVQVLMLTGMDGALRREHERALWKHYELCFAEARAKLGKHEPCSAEPRRPDHLRHGAALAALVMLSDMSLYNESQIAAACEDMAAILRP
eukprot:gnl/TRDRNA2_/TRDRNA2_146653_c0_seq3.p1 gnl/TRDRNA2_/TRDRNA2_146653_c0~~gnl/TRDRNA2_/TRDRNA2_146653_c0_seq3.p1  ORF type:complete len:330 (+),score=44.93 gnl/TRDRNA2_/TRDRNA2_146653_c0_seq3:22-1011(+)